MSVPSTWRTAWAFQDFPPVLAGPSSRSAVHEAEQTRHVTGHQVPGTGEQVPDQKCVQL